MRLKLIIYGVVIAILSAVDLISTYLLLAIPGNREGNPLMAIFINQPVLAMLIKIAIVAAVVIILWRILRRGYQGLLVWGYMGLTVALACVPVVSNIARLVG